MNKKNLSFIILVIFAIVSTFLIYKGCEKQDNIKFSEEYNTIGEDNVFTYRSLAEIISIMEKGIGVVYLGFPECPWCEAYVPYLNEIAKEEGIEKIYYYNIKEDRNNNTEGYQKIVKILKEHLSCDEEGNERIYVPNVSFHIRGKVIGFNNETSLDMGEVTPNEYWQEDKVQALKEELRKSFKQIYIALNACTECS